MVDDDSRTGFSSRASHTLAESLYGSEQPIPRSLAAFESVDDPRRVHSTTLHDLMDIIAITLMATLCGAANWVEIELWARSKEKWLKTVLPLPHGIPSHDTISRVFAMLDPAQMVEAFTAWTSELSQHIKGVVALDGKTSRRSMSTSDGRRSHSCGQCFCGTEQPRLDPDGGRRKGE